MGGGRGAERHASIIQPRGLILADYDTYQQELVRLGGRGVTGETSHFLPPSRGSLLRWPPSC